MDRWSAFWSSMGRLIRLGTMADPSLKATIQFWLSGDSEEEIRKFAMDPKKIVRCAEIIDKFGNNGITGVYIVNKNNEKEWMIDTFLLSCRVMSRGVEDGILSQIIQKAKINNRKRNGLRFFS